MSLVLNSFFGLLVHENVFTFDNGHCKGEISIIKKTGKFEQKTTDNLFLTIRNEKKQF